MPTESWDACFECEDCGTLVHPLELGDHFGYPRCCQEWFDHLGALYMLGMEQPKDTSEFLGSGYVPCAKHAVAPERARSHITANRKCGKPFERTDV